jgi:hypothetical protein
MYHRSDVIRVFGAVYGVSDSLPTKDPVQFLWSLSPTPQNLQEINETMLTGFASGPVI